MDRNEKAELVNELNAVFQESGVVVITRQSKMTVAESMDLRRKMRAAGARYKVTKNRIARIALKGTPYEPLDGMFTGPTAIATSVDPVAAAKVITEFAKKNDKLEIVGGGIGSAVIDAKGVEALSKMPSIEELRSKLLGVIVAPASKLVGTLQAAPTKMARVLNAPAIKIAGVLRAKAQQGE